MNSNTEILTNDEHAVASWPAIFAGTVASAAITLVLVAFGVGVGFSVISPWSGAGISASTFSISAGIYLIVIAMLSSTIGGYLAGRLRARWGTVHEHERYFRDSAHGFVVWAFATVLMAGVLGGATTAIVGGASIGVGAGAASGAATSSPATAGYVDLLLRPAAATPAAPAATAPSPAQANQQATEQAISPVPQGQTSPDLQGGQLAATQAPANDASRAEIGRIVSSGLDRGRVMAESDRAYLVDVVARHSGLPRAQAEARVTQVITQAKTAADEARKSTRNFAFWLAFAMLAGALSASLAAIEGGNLRNREWYLTGDGRTRVTTAK